MANEQDTFTDFIGSLILVLDKISLVKVFFVVDNASNDATYKLCKELSKSDKRFITIWAPENNNVVDAYLKGYKEALNSGYKYIIEMDAGLSHDPKNLPSFIECLHKGYDSVFGSRFIKGGAINSFWKRLFLSKYGTILSNFLVGTNYSDMTSGFQGFHRDIVEKFVDYKFLSKGHFYQTELRYLLRETKYIELPIKYSAPSPNIPSSSIINSIYCLFYYFFYRLTFRSKTIN